VALYIKTAEPSLLLNAIKAAIKAGHIKTWEYDKDGDFTHSAQQWKNLAWLRPRVEAEQLVFSIIGKGISWETYGIYHGRFIEMMIIHFHGQTTWMSASSNPVSPPDQLTQ
jgi:hypothetical protein